ncbi:MAG TPA: P1 family peptidase [Candidatus Marinimicrobia bacterium]|nr:P1 family peptidase [Candidatus Neomarinimicrobiota bacterium]
MQSYIKFISILMMLYSSILSGKNRARDLGIPFSGVPGTNNAITDVAGVTVGHSTIITGTGKKILGKGPIRTGVTAVLPRGNKSLQDPVFAGWYSLNGNGEMTGTTWIEESGLLEGPVMITNTHSVGVVRDAVIKWRIDEGEPDPSGYWWSLPVVAETYDGFLNDINGFHVKESHVFEALNTAKNGQVTEGNVGGGTGMMCHGFKGGIGTASRIFSIHENEYTLGVLVQANYGARKDLTIAGVPVGKEITDLKRERNSEKNFNEGDGSIIVVVATDVPLMPHQLKRLARRIPLGIARVGTVAHDGSGDIFIAFSTANKGDGFPSEIVQVEMVPNGLLNPVFEAIVHATEEAIINALIAAETMKGADDNLAYALPHERLVQIMKKYNR